MPSLRSDLVDATERLLRTRGMSRLTTREIAREAGCSDGALYTHFAGKAELVHAVIEERVPELREALGNLLDRVGAATIEENLRDIVRAALAFYRHLAPISSSVGAEPELLLSHRACMQRKGAGPRLTYQALISYLGAEQRLGRIDAGIDAPAAAALMIGACHNHALVCLVLGESPIDGDDDAFVAAVTRTLVGGLAPREPGALAGTAARSRRNDPTPRRTR